MKQSIEHKLIEAGVKNLRDFGYPDCHAENIFTDRIYAAFFKSMLEENRGHGFDREIDALIARISESTEPTAKP